MWRSINSRLLIFLNLKKISPLDSNPLRFNFKFQRLDSHSNLPRYFSAWSFDSQLKSIHDEFDTVNCMNSNSINVGNVERHNSLKNEILQFEFLDSAIEQFKNAFESKGSVNLNICNRLLNALAEAGQVNEAKKLFQRMKNSGILPNEKSFCMLIKAYNKLHNPFEAEEVLFEMKRNGILPSIIAYSSLMDAYASSAQINKTEKLFEMMMEDGCKPNAYTYSALIKAYTNGNECEKAEAIFLRMMKEDMDISIILCTQLLKSYFEQKLYDKVRLLMLFAKNKKIIMDETCYRVLIRGYSEANMWNEYDDVVNEMLSPSSRKPIPSIHTFHSILFSACNAGRMEKAKQIFRTYFDLPGMQSKPTTWTFNIMIKGFERLGQSFEANELFLLMIKNNIHPNMRTFHMLMEVYCQNFELEKAKLFLKKMKNIQMIPDSSSYNILIKGASECGDWNECKRLFDEMSQQGIKSNQENELTLIHAAMRTHQWRVARKIAGKVFKLRLQNILNFENEIDLHGLDYFQSISILLFILTFIKINSKQNCSDLNIITGIGKHSQTKNYSSVRSKVISFLKYEAKLRVVYKPWNKGILILKSPSLMHWFGNGGFEAMVNNLDFKCQKYNKGNVDFKYGGDDMV